MHVYASGISMYPAAFKIVEKFYFEDLSTDSFRFEAGECENNWLLSYFISDGGAGALHTLDRARGQGHSGVSCHEKLTNGWCSSWHALLYFVRMMTSPFSDRPCVHCVHTRCPCSLLIVASISLSWSPQPPIMSARAANSGAQNTSTQLHLCPNEGTLASATPKHSQRERGSSFWHFEEVIMSYFRISCFVHKLIIMSKNRKLHIFFTIWPKTHFGQEQERIVHS